MRTSRTPSLALHARAALESMGNQHSRSSTPTSHAGPQSPGVTWASHAQALHPGHDSSRLHVHGHGHAPNPRRRESIQALSTVKASAAPPASTLESAAAPAPSGRPHSRGRAQTVTSSTAAVAHTLRAAQDTLKPAADDKQDRHHGHHGHDSLDSMGNEQSRPKASTRPLSPPKAKHKPAVPSPQTRPVDVPQGPQAPRDETHTRTAAAASIEPADASHNDFIVPSSHYNRPPRLPLPIEQEIITPGSPIISPADVASPIGHGEIDGALPRRSSMLSTTTADDDDFGDEFKTPQGQPTVPTLIEWEGPGERVYVTGTFAGWNRKYKLHRNGPSKKKDVLSAYVHITPGTHHLMFFVDNDMRTSDKLPTAVDYTNILVNYLEVSYDDIPKTEADAPLERKPEPVPVQDRPAPVGIYPPEILPPTPELKAVAKPVPEPQPKVPPSSPKKYHQNIPRYLLDLDAAEESRHFARANAVAANLPTPPTLPMFLSKSILNGVTPMKDDSSVLILPNHTVLNHLATSSIKDNILATSATTRYKQKFLTTIMYKPKHEDDREH